MINHTTATRLLIGILTLSILFHLLVLFAVIPYHVAWGGSLESAQQMYVFESVSIALNLFLIGMVMLKAKGKSSKIVNPILWVFMCLFLLNTVGNLFAKTSFEKFFAIVTLLIAFLLFSILMKKRGEEASRYFSKSS